MYIHKFTREKVNNEYNVPNSQRQPLHKELRSALGTEEINVHIVGSDIKVIKHGDEFTASELSQVAQVISNHKSNA